MIFHPILTALIKIEGGQVSATGWEQGKSVSGSLLKGLENSRAVSDLKAGKRGKFCEGILKLGEIPDIPKHPNECSERSGWAGWGIGLERESRQLNERNNNRTRLL
ncbi:MAG: hypothetical protein JWM47_4579 [Acidimicrobiales bacterium]|nr:hypothetical protein [Acidimicrobiales bacterium]